MKECRHFSIFKGMSVHQLGTQFHFAVKTTDKKGFPKRYLPQEAGTYLLQFTSSFFLTKIGLAFEVRGGVERCTQE